MGKRLSGLAYIPSHEKRKQKTARVLVKSYLMRVGQLCFQIANLLSQRWNMH